MRASSQTGLDAFSKNRFVSAPPFRLSRTFSMRGSLVIPLYLGDARIELCQALLPLRKESAAGVRDGAVGGPSRVGRRRHDRVDEIDDLAEWMRHHRMAIRNMVLPQQDHGGVVLRRQVEGFPISEGLVHVEL